MATIAAIALSVVSLSSAHALGSSDRPMVLALAKSPTGDPTLEPATPWSDPLSGRELPLILPVDPAGSSGDASRADAASDADLTARLALWAILHDADSAPPFATITAFIDANPGWPQLFPLRDKAERAITRDVPDGDILAWFRKYPPRTWEGAAAQADALLRAGDTAGATVSIRGAWTEFSMSEADEGVFLSRFGKYLDADAHWARLDRLLWDRQVSPAQRQMTRVDAGHRALADARLRLMRLQGGVEMAQDRVPPALADDPGLAYERLRWLRRKEQDTAAIDILLSPPAAMEYPSRWWTEREILTRRLLSDKNPALAYRLVRDHGLTDPGDRSEAEFLAGWIALRFLHDPHTAFRHFADLYEFVRFPISRARAAYWAGRAAEDAGDESAASQWYRAAAVHGTTFYGQLAVGRLNGETPPPMPAEPAIDAATRAAFDHDELVRAVHILIALRDGKPAEDSTAPAAMLAELDEDSALVPFLRHIAWRADTPEQWVLAARLAHEADRDEIAVSIARKAGQAGVVLGELGYPTMSMPEMAPPDPALLHALVRQESGFDPGARSRVGARGLMQLMPSTAQRMARTLKVGNHSTERLTSDPYHNVLLGSAYLDTVLDRYDGSIVMALAAYNAGPNRVDRWLKDNGDPRASLDQAVDWIEMIPFSETRNYVQRVLESLPIYRSRLEGGRVAALRPEDLTGPASR